MPLFLIRAFIAPTLTLAAHPFLWAGSDSHLGQLPSLFENQSEERFTSSKHHCRFMV